MNYFFAEDNEVIDSVCNSNLLMNLMSAVLGLTYYRQISMIYQEELNL